MLAYAAKRQGVAGLRSSPSTMLFIAGAHVAAIAVAMSMKMTVEHGPEPTVTKVDLVEVPLPPPPAPEPRKAQQAPRSTPFQPPVEIPTPPLALDPIGTTPVPQPAVGPIVGTAEPVVPQPGPVPIPAAEPVRIGPRLNTPATALRPPYPSSKLDAQEEAALRLRLSIDERGRVVAVDSVGRADPAFLNAARKHLIAKWRYQPATVDGRPIASSTVITLRFELDG